MVKKLFFLLIFLLIIASRLPFLNKELTWEEPLVIKSANSIISHGFPYYYGGEQYNDKSSLSIGYPNKTNAVNLGKPPFFLFFVSIPVRIFSFFSETIKFRSTIFLPQLILFIFFYYYCLKRFKSLFIATFGLLIFAFNPYIVQLSTQLAIDGTVLALSLFLLFLSFENLNKNSILKNYLIYFILFFISFGIRHETTVFFLISFLIYLVLKKEFKILSIVFTTSIGAIFLYFTFFYFYTKSFDETLFLAPTGIIEGVLSSFFYPKLSGVTKNIFSGGVMLIDRLIVWVSPFFALLYLISISKINRQNALWHILIIINLSIFFIVGWTGHFIPRYFAPIIPFMILSILSLIKKTKLNIKILLLSVFLVTIIFSLEKFTIFLNLQRDLIINSTHLKYWIFVVIALFISSFINSLNKLFIALFIISLFIWQIRVNYNDSITPYSFTSLYGNYGYREAGLYLKNTLKTNDIIVTMDAIGFYYDRKYYDWYETYPYPSRNILFQEVFLSKDRDIKAIALPKADFLTPEIDIFNINSNSYENKDFGTIKVYIKK